MGMNIRKTICPSRHKGELGGGGVTGSTIKKSGEAVRLAPTLDHACGFIWERTKDKYKSPLNTQGAFRRGGGGGLGVTNSKVMGSCQTAGPIGTTFGTHLQIHNCYGNGYTPNKLPPLDTWGGGTWGGGGVRGQTFKRLGELSKGLADWHQLWFTSADSSGNGHRLNPSRPSIPQEALGGGGLRGHKFKRLGKLSNGFTDWHNIRYTSADSSGNGHRLNTIRPTVPQWHFGRF